MAKILLWVILILGAMLVARVISHRNARERMAARRSDPLPSGDMGRDAEAMVRCAHCNIFLPRSEAFMSQGKTWCCAEHAQIGLKK